MSCNYNLELELYVLPTTPNAVIVNLTNWVNNQTDYSLSLNVSLSDTIGAYYGLVLRRLNAGKGIVITLTGGKFSSNFSENFRSIIVSFNKIALCC